MTKLTPLLFFLLSSNLCLFAQQPASPGPSAVAPVTVIGCVVGLNGSYSLNAGSGKTFILSGDNLQQFSGQQVRILGNVTYSKKPGTNGKAENMVIRGDQPTLAISKIDKLADTCKH